MGFLALALPMLCASFLFMLNEMTNVIVLGQRGSPEELASLGLVQCIYNCGLMSPGMGFQTVMDSVVAQSYGAGNRALCMTYLQQCRFLIVCLSVVVFPLFWFSEPILLLFGQEAVVAAQTTVPARMFWIGGVCTQKSILTFQFLKNIGDLSTIWMFAVGNVVHVSCAIIFVSFLDMGSTGVGIAMVCQSAVLTSLMHYYLINKSPVKEFSLVEKLAITSQSFDGIGNYLALGIPAVVSSAAESWFWEVNTVIIGWLGAISLASHSSVQSLVSTLLAICASTAASGTTLVSRSLGSGHPRAARSLAFSSVMIICCLWAVISGALYFFDHPLARLFNSNPTVLEGMYTLMHLQILGGLCSCVQIIAGSVLKGMLKYRLVAAIFFVSYYVVAVPLGYYLGIVCKLGVAGIYTSFAFGMSLSSLTLTATLSNVDFDRVTRETMERLQRDSAPKKM